MIEIQNLCKSFGERTLFSNYSLTVPDGEFIFFSGVSGCGKTTLLNMIGAIEPFDGGNILVNGKSVANRRFRSQYFKTEVGFLFQNFALVEGKTVKENLALVKNACRTEVSIAEALQFVGLPDKQDQPVYTLSGGEQQRVALARLLIKKCSIVLADEPTGSLDRQNAEAVFALLEKLNERGKTVVVVSHDESFKNRGKQVIELGTLEKRNCDR